LVRVFRLRTVWRNCCYSSSPGDAFRRRQHGGAIPLKVIDDQLALTVRLSGCLPDWRQAGKVEHDLLTMIRHRRFGFACRAFSERPGPLEAGKPILDATGRAIPPSGSAQSLTAPHPNSLSPTVGLATSYCVQRI
jgi:hypothetical protein